MPGANGQSSANDVLTALGLAIFRREEDRTLRLQGDPPDWLRALWPALRGAGDALPVAQASPFFENFLIDAAECWQKGGAARARSGPWIESAPDGSEVTLEATALIAEGQAILLLERQGEAFENRRQMLQTARETVIALQRLNSETQKKEVLLSWIAEQMNAALANVITSLRLIELENSNPPRTRQLISLAARAADEQQALINRILDVFKSELESLYGRTNEPPIPADVSALAPAVEKAIAALEPRARLVVSNQASPGTCVAMGEEALQRVVATLLEVCFKNSADPGEITFAVRDEGETVALSISDDGAPLPPDICEGLLSKASADSSDAIHLQLQFCHVPVQTSGGEILYQPREPKGNCFTIRLPKAPAK